jgi:hypothetical protein
MTSVVDASFTGFYIGVAIIASALYGLRGFLISRRWNYVTRHEICHQVWFNAAGSAMGWLAGYWILQRFGRSCHTPGIMDVILVIFAALGIVGYLPQTLNAVPGLPSYLGDWAKN